MRIFCVMFLFFFLLSLAHGLSAITIEKEFIFTLMPGEDTKDWEVNIPLPTGAIGKFIGRNFKPIFNDTAYSFQVVREALTEKNYYVKVRLLKILNVAKTPPPAILQVTIQIGTIALNETPKLPIKIHWYLGKVKEIEWENWGSDKTVSDSAKYLTYVLKIADTGQLLGEQVVPIYLIGPRFPVHYVLPQNKKIAFTFQASNTSAKNSLPTSGYFQIGASFAQ